MSRQIVQPVNQVRLTNVAVVRLSRGGHRFEVACYRNKIVNYRQGTETDLSEVLQTERIFTNVSKGQFANSKTLKKCFDTSNEEEVCRFILANGDVQVSDQERAAQLESTAREVASMVSEKCVHPISRRPYTLPQIRDGMKAAGFMVHPTRNIKQQFLDCVRLLQEKRVLDIERAKMKLAIVLSQLQEANDHNDGLTKRRDAVTTFLINEGVAAADIQPSTGDNDTRIIFQSDPSLYRRMDGIARHDDVQGRLEIIQQCVTEEGDVTLGHELERKAQQQQQRDEHHVVQSSGKQHATQSGANDNNDDDNDDVPALSDKLQSGLRLTSNTDTNNDDNDHDDHQSTITKVANSRKAQKAAQKKSKKAKRREKEDAVEREEKIAAEKARQKERDERRGIQQNSTAGDGATTSISNNTNQVSNAGDTKACNTCGGSFAPHEYRSHFRSDWHRYNVKLKMKGCATVSEKEFLLCDSDAFF
ncbi:ribosome maturation protein SBDS [Skeletonema marinoi]|uniref:Ribosome maturation protein SBDS n=1 Tax=Skeletonema marinoi TaxID=267567 RepID=A0AAD9D5L8_9STRA|nr:ribosome maturation protein SBDS [Skeletonema marinoi]